MVTSQVFMQLKNPTMLFSRALCFGCATPEHPTSVAQHLVCTKADQCPSKATRLTAEQQGLVSAHPCEVSWVLQGWIYQVIGPPGTSIAACAHPRTAAKGWSRVSAPQTKSSQGAEAETTCIPQGAALCTGWDVHYMCMNGAWDKQQEKTSQCWVSPLNSPVFPCCQEHIVLLSTTDLTGASIYSLVLCFSPMSMQLAQSIPLLSALTCSISCCTGAALGTASLSKAK